MGEAIIFKRLFEVQILHDYFLTTVDGESFFDKNKADKESLILRKLQNRLYDIRDLFEIEAVGTTKSILNNYKLIVAKTALGFIVGTEVVVENQAGVTLYKPRFEFSNDTHLTFSIKPSASFFNSISNISLRPPLPSIYYFTNKDKEVFDEAPFLYTSLPISNEVNIHQDGVLYEMGALADFGGTIREAVQYTDGNDPAHWVDITDKRFVSDADRALLPHNFSYTFKKEQNITQVEFVLEDENNNELKTISKSGLDTLDRVHLNFTKVDENNANSDDIPDGQYSLKVKANAGPEIVYQIYLNNDIYDKNYFAIVDIRFDELDSPYSLLDNKNYLKTRIDALDEKVTHPIFEIRLKNRRTYWRYNREGGFSEDDVNATNTFLKPEPELPLVPEKLISLDPKGLTETLVPFINGTTLMLPHPRMPSIKIEKERIFSEIFINQSNRLLNN
ncbi:hypothetical protein [Aquimarina mytili]|uniref:Uncharacterized protein n=1 Tax=Aquimarina mytili TaxID=874423 RepID=A0A937A3T3_9FLAO|nr:hypothetical protein [Aquimarina mytili]MBL0683854.1 hypothetical protein [Aquimarina mytili]